MVSLKQLVIKILFDAYHHYYLHNVYVVQMYFFDTLYLLLNLVEYTNSPCIEHFIERHFKMSANIGKFCNLMPATLKMPLNWEIAAIRSSIKTSGD